MLSTIIVLFLVERTFSLNLPFLYYLFVLFLVLFLYALFELFNLFINIYEIFKEIISILLYPFKRAYSILKRKKDDKEHER